MTQAFRFTAAISADKSNPRRLHIVGYSGNVMSVSGMGAIVIDLDGLDSPPRVPVLRDHDNTVAGVVGSATPQVVNGQLHFMADCADTEAANDVLRILQTNGVLQASVGGNPGEVERIREGESVNVNGRSIRADDDFTLVRTFKLSEITIVPCGADPTTSVSIAARRKKGKRPMNAKAMLLASGKYTAEEIDQMTEAQAKAELKKCMAPDEPDEDDNPDNKKADAAAIIDIMGEYSSRAIMAQAAKERWTVRECKRQALNDLRANRPGAGVGVVPGGYYSRPNGNSMNHEDDVFVGAILARCGLESFGEKKLGAQAMEMSRPLHRMPMTGIISAYLNANHVRHDPHDFDGMMQIRADGPSSVSVPSLLGNVMGKTLEFAWQAQPATWRSWCAQKQAKDFKQQSSIRPSMGNTMTQLNPSGEIEHATFTDWMINWQVLTFAKLLTVPRAYIINDDLSAFGEIPTSFAAMAERALADLVYANLLANNTQTVTTGNTSVSRAFFHTSNGNILTGGSAPLSSTSLATAFQSMRKQTAPNGSPLNLQPAVLIVAPSLEQTARALLNSQFMITIGLASTSSASVQPAGNPLQGSCALEVEARLELGCTSPVNGSSAQSGTATKWFLAAAPANLPAIVGTLGGGPQIQTAGPDYNFNLPGMSVRCILDAGFSVGDYRAMYYSAGA